LVIFWSGELADVMQDVEDELVIGWLAAGEHFDHGIDGAQLNGVVWVLTDAAHVPMLDILCI
jgi:hypothetical protein